MEIESSRVFVKVVQQESFTRAAALLRVPPSTVSRTISRLESEVGAKLLLRTTRRVTLTPAGRAFFERVVGPVLQIEDARRNVQGADESLSGHVRITAVEDHGALIVTPVVSRLMRRYPGLTFDLHYTTEVTDLVKGSFDLALRVGKLNLSRFKSLRLGQISFIVVASPDYLTGRDKIRIPQDLVNHACLTFGAFSENMRWVFSSKQEKVKVSVKPHSTANQMQSLVTLAMGGVGVAFVPDLLCRRQIANGELIHVLPDWTVSSFDLHLISPVSSKMPARVKLVADEIAAAVKATLLKT